MEAPKVTADAPTTRGWLDRWWLLSANLLVANAVSLHTDLGGLRTPSPALNLWITALVLLAPWLRWSLRKIPRFGNRRIDKLASVLARLLVAALMACVLGAPLGIAATFALVPLTMLPASAWPPAAVALVAGLLADALWTGPRSVVAARCFAAVRALAWLPPGMLLAMVMMFVPIDAPAWVGGVDTMFEPVARIDERARSYVAVRSDPMAFTHPTIRILVAVPIVPGLVGWWRELDALYKVKTVELRIDGDELCVAYHRERDDEESPVRQCRLRIR